MDSGSSMDLFLKIEENNVKREKATLSKYGCPSIKGERRFPREDLPVGQRIRPAFFHDTDRIIHSHAYSRYIDKTQVFFLFNNDHITHRVLHVQFVSKISRVIGRALGLNEDLLEAISLGHDLGHVPYGHDGERYLDAICQEKGEGCFCHNAQSVRALMELENDGKGLDLTLQVLDGILCHNGEILDEVYEPDWNKTWDRFLEEYRQCFIQRDFSKKIKPGTLEGCLVRICDIVAYIGRDIEDAITLRLIKREDLPEDVTEVLGNTNSDIINTLVLDIIKNSYDKPYIRFSRKIYEAFQKLLDFNRVNIYQNPKKETENDKIKNMFRTIFDVYYDQIDKGVVKSLEFQQYLEDMGEEYLKNNSPTRIVIDYIAGMTDNFFNNVFQNLVFPRNFGRHIGL